MLTEVSYNRILPLANYCKSEDIFSSLIQNMIYKLIVQTFVAKTSKFVYKFQLLTFAEQYVSDINVNQ